jgi:cytochrome c oxidase subunit 2
VGTTAKIIAISYLVVVVVGALIALAVWRTTRTRSTEPDTERLARRERAWLGVVIVLLVALLFGTIFFIPYADSAGANGQVVNVQSQQFGWVIEPSTVEAGTPVEFRLTSKDVNHGFGLYTRSGKLLFEVQVIPGHTQKGVYTFERPGTYQILCLEFCGVGHHLMRGTITVEPAQ